MRTLMIWALIGAIAGALVLGGCSGAGVSAFDASGGSLQTLAADHLAALVLVRSWLVALHSHPQSGSTATFTQENLPDGSTRFVGTNSDGSTFDYILRPDNSGEGTWWLGPDRPIVSAWGPLLQQGAVYTQEFTQTFWDGMALHQTIVTDFTDPTAMVITYTGSATLGDGRAMDFTVVQRAREHEDITLELPDGSTCEYRVPLTFRDFSSWEPDYSREAAGHYVSPTGERQDFTLTGRGSRWVRWDLVAPDGTTAQFTLDPDYAGDGTLVDDGRVLAALRWDADASGVLDLLSAQSAEVGPTGAALDFAIDRWIENAALLGPAPMY